MLVICWKYVGFDLREKSQPSEQKDTLDMTMIIFLALCARRPCCTTEWLNIKMRISLAFRALLCCTTEWDAQGVQATRARPSPSSIRRTTSMHLTWSRRCRRARRPCHRCGWGKGRAPETNEWRRSFAKMNLDHLQKWIWKGRASEMNERGRPLKKTEVMLKTAFAHAVECM